RGGVIVLPVYGGLLALTYEGFRRTPKGFIPAQDKGYLLVNLQLPDSASVLRTKEAVHKLEKIARDSPGVAHTVAIAGQSLLLNANAPNFGSMYVMLEDFHDRAHPNLSTAVISPKLLTAFQQPVPQRIA